LGIAACLSGVCFDILPANTPIEFTLDKDKMKFKLNGKKYEFLVVGMSAIQAQ
jgi:hypothetical protein